MKSDPSHLEQQAQPEEMESAPPQGLKWQASDTSFLLPNNIARVQRAWDRRPLPPFSKQRLRVGKVWKRPNATMRSTNTEIQEDGRVVKRRRSRNSSDLALKPVKKMCLDYHFGIGARVLAWDRDGGESPVRKILTRRMAIEEDLVALPEEEDELNSVAEGQGGVQVEILDEDGTVVDVNAEETFDEQSEWEDEAQSDGADESEEFNGTMMHLTDIVGSPQRRVDAAAPNQNISNATREEAGSAESTMADLPAESEEDTKFDEDATEADADASEAKLSLAEQTQTTNPRHPANNVVLPDGFVSPAKKPSLCTQRRPMIRFTGSRRRTLPVHFAPTLMEADTSSFPRDVGGIEITETTAEAGDDIHDNASEADGDSDGLKAKVSPAERSHTTVAEPLVKDVVLPEGFVSPAKPQRVQERRSTRLSSGLRRRTLPVQFAPALIEADPPHSLPIGTMETNEDGTVSGDDQFGDDLTENVPTGKGLTGVGPPGRDGLSKPAKREQDGEEEWEDIEEASLSQETLMVQQDALDRSEAIRSLEAMEEQTRMDLSETIAEDTEEAFEYTSTEPISASSIVQSNELATAPPMKLPSSPIPSIEGQHPRLPLRRSPRRKSSSPLKQSTIFLSNEKPHLVAFTPIKAPAQKLLPFVPPSPIAQTTEADDNGPTPSSPTERAASAPPEPLPTSPQKSSRPRVSDDTALLQAFLNRAAENKSSRRISTAKRESITNRRDSDAVRYALASPQAKNADVLAELDPNSPSPRKASAFSASEQNHQQMDTEASTIPAVQDEDVPSFEDTLLGQRTRRSDRAATKSKAGPATPALPNKISIRANGENVVLKRSEAQELALLTRNNTRKNKGGSVLPPLRLTKIALQLSNAHADGEVESVEDAAEGMKNVDRKGIKWAETLVEYFQGGEVSESSVLSDEPGSQSEPVQGQMETEPANTAPNPVVAPPPPSETPSKPKIRRLKAPTRTAATPGKLPPAPVDAEQISAPQSIQPPSKASALSTKKRSRIATPAKGLGSSASLLPEDVDFKPAAPTPAAETRIAASARKKVPLVSKLPAPAVTVSQGKENNLISSPPKKKSTAPSALTMSKSGMPTVKTFAPRLDFSKSTRLEPEQAPENTMPGLASPAKKSGRGRGVLFPGKSSEVEDGSRERTEVPGLQSPAKKRTRRALV